MSAVDGVQENGLEQAFDTLRAVSRAQPYPSRRTREGWLRRLLNAVIARREEYARVVSADFGHRSWHETQLGEVMVTADSIRFDLKHLRKWMKPTRKRVVWYAQPGAGRVQPQPKGLVGIFVPFNYPLQLAITPLSSALAAGNRAIIKPSEMVPRTSAFIEELVTDCLPSDVVQVVQGDAEVGARFASLPWDHLFFTGSPRVGKLVMKAAAEHLTPVTLELGGKSPVWIAPGFDMDRVARRVVMAALFNGGQTCIRADTVLVHEDDEARFIDALDRQIRIQYPSLLDNPDYTSMYSDAHHARTLELVNDARERGATIHEVNPADEDMSGSRKVAPTLVSDCPTEARIAQEEIFGPVTLVKTYRDKQDAVDYLNAGERPLVMYLFDDDPERVEHLLSHTTTGGAVVNDVFVNMACSELPFGGIGHSGMGAYHGKAGFDTFSHQKAVYYSARLSGRNLFLPPYGRLVNKVLPLLIGSE